MTGFTALLDADILYPAPMRDIFLHLAVDDPVRAKWTADIHRAWINALVRNEPNRDRTILERTRDRMDRATRDCLVTGYQALVPTLCLPDPDDRHVPAATMVGRCHVIVTCNLRDFPEDAVAPHGLEFLRSDDFLTSYLDLMPGPICDAARTTAAWWWRSISRRVSSGSSGHRHPQGT